MSGSPAVLERCARALLLAYPAQYRRERGEEIIGTLLEAAPPGQRFPSARDTWALIAGGRHARAARNRGPSARANLRLVLLLGLSLYVTSDTAGFLLAPNGPHIAAAVAGTAAALAPWLGSRTATTTLAIPAGGLTAYAILIQPGQLDRTLAADLAEPLIALFALAALSGGPARLPRSWAWLPCVAPAAVAWTAALHPMRLEVQFFADSQLLLAAVTVAWLIVDARPAFAFYLGHLVSQLLLSLYYLFALPGMPYAGMLTFYLVDLAVIGAITLAVGWLFRRQTAGLRVRPRS